jgi:phosphoketolase
MADPLTANHKAPEHMALELEHRGRDRREAERQNLALLGTINEMGGKIRRDAESNWHFSIEAPRWAVRSPEGNTATAIVAGVAAFLLAGFAF